MRDLIRKVPGFGPAAESLHQNLLGSEMDKPLPRLDFDLSKQNLQMGSHRLKFIDLMAGTVQVDGRDFVWNREITYYQNWERLYRRMTETPAKSADWIYWILPTAEAQNRDFFPPADEEAQAKTDDSTPYSRAAGGLGYMGFVSLIKKVPWRAELGEVGFIGMVAIATDLAMNYGFAFYRPSFHKGYVKVDDCEAQSKTLKTIMNQAHISLSGFTCHNEIGKRDTNISFFTPDKKLLPMVANWESSSVWVNPSEIYNFNYRALDSVKRSDATLSSGPKFEEYKKNLEPYRQVLFQMGLNNSCFRCEPYFQEHLVYAHPVTYSMDNGPTVSGVDDSTH
jgi:hypothetical protein